MQTTKPSVALQTYLKTITTNAINKAHKLGYSLPCTPVVQFTNDLSNEHLGLSTVETFAVETTTNNSTITTYESESIIQLSTELLTKPKQFIKEILLHELAHVFEFHFYDSNSNHGKEFTKFCNIFNIKSQSHYDF